MKKMSIDQKVLFIVLGIFGLVVLFLGYYFFLMPKFRTEGFVAKVEIPYESTYNVTAGTVCYGSFFHCEPLEATQKGEVDTSKVDNYTVTYVYEHDGKSLELLQEVSVVDKESPTISVNSEELYYCASGKVYNYEATAYDNYDGDVSSNIEVFLEGSKAIFQVEDSFGNQSRVQKDATLKDEEVPILTMNGEASVYIPLNGVYEEASVTASDNCDGDLTDKITVEGTVDTSKAGEYVITYRVSDSNQNEATLSRHVYVYQANNYADLSGKNIYLTFDDGPSKYTARLLDILKKYNVKATFFVTDQNLTKGYDDVLKRAYEEGHTIGLHSSTHSYGYIYSSVDNYFTDLYAIQTKVKNITGYAPMIIRFPGGSSNTVSRSYDGGARIMTQLSQAVQAKGFRYFDWNIDSKDSSSVKNSAQVASNVINQLGNKSTYVVLQHDIKDYSVEAVETIIQFGLSHGYSFQALKMDSPRVEHTVNN